MVPCRRRTLTQYSAFFIRSLSKLSIAVHTILVICRAANCIYMMVIERLAATNKIHFLQKMSEHFFLFFFKSSNLIYSRIFAPSFFFLICNSSNKPHASAVTSPGWCKICGLYLFSMGHLAISQICYDATNIQVLNDFGLLIWDQGKKAVFISYTVPT